MPTVYYQDDDYERGCNQSFFVSGERWEYVQGNVLDIEVYPEDREIRADVIIKRKNGVRVCGQIKDCNGRPIDYALVKLLKPAYIRGKLEYEGVTHGMTDSMGYYQFLICNCTRDCNSNTKFKILVNKAESVE